MISESETMPDLLVRDLSPELHQALKERAERHHRSLSAEVVSIVERAVLGPRPMTTAELKARRVVGLKPLTEDVLEQARKERP